MKRGALVQWYKQCIQIIFIALGVGEILWHSNWTIETATIYCLHSVCKAQFIGWNLRINCFKSIHMSIAQCPSYLYHKFVQSRLYILANWKLFCILQIRFSRKLKCTRDINSSYLCPWTHLANKYVTLFLFFLYKKFNHTNACTA